MPAYLETEQELSRLARRAAGMRGGPRLLIVPGIMGSSIGLLRKNGGVDVTWFDPVEIAQGQLVKLAMPAGSRYWAVGVLKFAYERLRLVLRIAGFDAVFHPYDWRRDIAWNGRELADRLLREKRQDVVIVAHSAGGLVVRAALAHKGGERIGRVIQLGTPNKGVFVAVQALRGTYPLVRRVAMLDLKHSADDLARQMLTTLPGLCGLLPAAQLCKDFDPFDATQWPEGPRPEADLLKAAHESIATLPPPDQRFRLIAGFGQDTVLGLRRSGRKLEFGRGPAGDGTVPLALAHWPKLPTWYVEESHGSLPGNADVGRAVADLAQGDKTDALPTVLPRRRGVSTLWQEDVRLAPAPKIAWGDLSEREQREFLHEFIGVTQPSTSAAAPKRDGGGEARRARLPGKAASRRAPRPRSCSAPSRTSSPRALPSPSTACCTARSATSRGGAPSARRPARCSCCRSADAASRRGSWCSPGLATSRATAPTCSVSRRRTSRARSRSPASIRSRWCSGARPPAPSPRTPREPSSRAC